MTEPMGRQTMADQQLRVWWIPQIPMQPFHVPVRDIEQANFLLSALAKYDLFQLEHNIKPDYSNAGGLEVFEDGEWCEWYDEEGYDIDQHFLRLREEPAS